MLTTDHSLNRVLSVNTPVVDAPDIFSVGHVHVIYGDFHTFSSRGLTLL